MKPYHGTLAGYGAKLTGFDGMVRRDLEYIAKRGIVMDLKIVLPSRFWRSSTGAMRTNA